MHRRSYLEGKKAAGYTLSAVLDAGASIKRAQVSTIELGSGQA
jgi:hypothetical protein